MIPFRSYVTNNARRFERGDRDHNAVAAALLMASGCTEAPTDGVTLQQMVKNVQGLSNNHAFRAGRLSTYQDLLGVVDELANKPERLDRPAILKTLRRELGKRLSDDAQSQLFLQDVKVSRPASKVEQQLRYELHAATAALNAEVELVAKLRGELTENEATTRLLKRRLAEIDGFDVSTIPDYTPGKPGAVSTAIVEAVRQFGSDRHGVGCRDSHNVVDGWLLRLAEQLGCSAEEQETVRKETLVQHHGHEAFDVLRDILKPKLRASAELREADAMTSKLANTLQSIAVELNLRPGADYSECVDAVRALRGRVGCMPMADWVELREMLGAQGSERMIDAARRFNSEFVWIPLAEFDEAKKLLTAKDGEKLIDAARRIHGPNGGVVFFSYENHEELLRLLGAEPHEDALSAAKRRIGELQARFSDDKYALVTRSEFDAIAGAVGKTMGETLAEAVKRHLAVKQQQSDYYHRELLNEKAVVSNVAAVLDRFGFTAVSTIGLSARVNDALATLKAQAADLQTKIEYLRKQNLEISRAGVERLAKQRNESSRLWQQLHINVELYRARYVTGSGVAEALATRVIGFITSGGTQW